MGNLDGSCEVLPQPAFVTLSESLAPANNASYPGINDTSLGPCPLAQDIRVAQFQRSIASLDLAFLEELFGSDIATINPSDFAGTLEDGLDNTVSPELEPFAATTSNSYPLLPPNLSLDVTIQKTKSECSPVKHSAILAREREPRSINFSLPR